MEELIAKLIHVKNLRKALSDQDRELKGDEELLKAEVRVKLQELGMTSAKTQSGSVSVVQKPNLVITNEQAVREWLENTPEVESDLYIRLDKTAFKSLAKSWFDNTGELINGTDTEVSEYLQVKEKK